MNPKESESKAEVLRRAIVCVIEHVAEAIAEELLELPSPELILEQYVQGETEK